jgi:hypothetical protein
MRHVSVPITSMLFAVLLAATASAQPAPSSDRPPVEIGVGVSGLAVTGLDFLDPHHFGPAADVRLTLPLTRRFSFETNVMVTRDTNAFEQRTRGLYALLLKQRLIRASSERTEVFLTYGGTGYFAHVSSDFFAGEPYTEIDPPIASTIGAGFQRRVARHLAVRADAQLLTVLYLPLGFRLAGGVSIPFGGYATETPSP